jgi:putative ABC transport system permease protein
MSPERRRRLERALVTRWSSRRSDETPSRGQLAEPDVAALRALPHAQAVNPVVQMTVRPILLPRPDDPVAVDNGRTPFSSLVSVEPNQRDYHARVVAGSPLPPEGGRVVVVHEYLLYRWGLTTDEQVASSIGRTVRIRSTPRRTDAPSLANLLRFQAGLTEDEALVLERTFRQVAKFLAMVPLRPEERDVWQKAFRRAEPAPAPEAEEPPPDVDLRIVGVIRQFMEDDPRPTTGAGYRVRDAELLVPAATAAEIYLIPQPRRQRGLDQVSVTADREENVRALGEAIEKRGHRVFSLAIIIDTVRTNVLLITLATTFVAIVALTVAALGITNTMIMSVLERTREIGVMKALGARDGHVQAVFLVEGALIGGLGGLLGLALARLAALPADAFARALIERQTEQPITSPIFIFPAWLALGAPAVAVLVTTIAALYPARRAAALDPVTSLRHE